MGRNPNFVKIINDYSSNLCSLWCPILGVSSPQLVSSGSCPTLYHANSLSEFFYQHKQIIKKVEKKSYRIKRLLFTLNKQCELSGVSRLGMVRGQTKRQICRPPRYPPPKQPIPCRSSTSLPTPSTFTALTPAARWRRCKSRCRQAAPSHGSP